MSLEVVLLLHCHASKQALVCVTLASVSLLWNVACSFFFHYFKICSRYSQCGTAGLCV